MSRKSLTLCTTEFSANYKSITLWFDWLAFVCDKMTLFAPFDDVLRHQRWKNVDSLFPLFHIHTSFTSASREYWHLRFGNHSKDSNGSIESHFIFLLQVKRPFFCREKKAAVINKFNHKNKTRQIAILRLQCVWRQWIFLNFLCYYPFPYNPLLFPFNILYIHQRKKKGKEH